MVKSKPNIKKMEITMRSLMELVYCLLSTDERKTKQSKTYTSYRLLQSRPIIDTGKIITSSNSLNTPAKSIFSNILLKSVITNYFITKKILKLFDKVSDKFDLVRNWIVVGELMNLP